MRTGRGQQAIELRDERSAAINALLQFSPNIPNRTAAKLLHDQRPDLFPDVENARCAMRYRTGVAGRSHRADAQANFEGSFREPYTAQSLPPPTPFWDSTPFIFNTGKCLIISDIHIPFHAPAAIETAVKDAKRSGCHDVLLLGDVLDHYAESDFCKIPDVATLKQELTDGKQFFHWLRKQFPRGRIVYKKGNHEERWENRVHRVMPEVGRLLDSFTDNFMGLPELGVEVVGDRRRIDMGYLTAIHGHELGKGVFNPVNAARTMQLRAKECSIVAHWHTPAQHRVRTIRQNHIGTWALGCLCHLNPHYRPVNDWEHGYAIFERLDKAGGFTVANKTIIGGRPV